MEMHLCLIKGVLGFQVILKKLFGSENGDQNYPLSDVLHKIESFIQER